MSFATVKVPNCLLLARSYYNRRPASIAYRSYLLLLSFRLVLFLLLLFSQYVASRLHGLQEGGLSQQILEGRGLCSPTSAAEQQKKLCSPVYTLELPEPPLLLL